MRLLDEFVFAIAFCVLIGNVVFKRTLLRASAAGARFCLVGGQVAAKAFAGDYYSAAIRATGIGRALGIEGSGSMFGPLIGGTSIDLQVTDTTLFCLV